jgi:hypothetical protein
MALKLIILGHGAIIRLPDYSLVCALAELSHYLAQTSHALNFSEAY